MSDHAQLSPSARHRWGACPGSVREEAKYPEQPAGPAAIDGTHSHTLLEFCLKNPFFPPESLIGQEMEDHEGKFVVDADRAARVRIALDYIKARAEELKPSVVHSEMRVDPAPLLGRSDMSGTADCMIISDTVAEIIDYKDGINPVNAKDNDQMEQYTWGMLAMYPNAKFKRIRMTIIQPKLKVKGIDPISSHEVDVEDFMRRMGTIIDQAAATDDPNAPLTPGESQCKYCRAKGGCSALAQHTMKASGIVFQNLDVAQQAADKQSNELTDEQLRELIEAAPLIRQMLEGAEKEAMRRFESGHPVAGLKVVKGKGSREWALDDEQIAAKLKMMGLTKGEIYPAKLITPAQAEKLIEAKAQEKGQDPSRKLNTLATEYIAKKDGKPTLALESDPRSEITLNAAHLFGAVK